MPILLILLAVWLTGCATTLTAGSPSIKDELLEPCGKQIADPLTTADQHDLARALDQAVVYGKDCAKKQAELAGAVKVRELMREQLEKRD
jgi:hypothetical protein